MTIRDNIIRYRLVEKHLQLVREGSYDVARNILHLLIRSEIRLGLSDISSETEFILENRGLHPFYSRNYNSVRFYLVTSKNEV